jgi:BioD-like phosphotransacetylase family protein
MCEYWLKLQERVRRMDKVIVASVRPSAGKTSIIAGLARVRRARFGYLKPFGDRLIYDRKRLWDYDSSALASLFRLRQEPEEMSLGFHHSKLRYAYDATSVREKLQQMASAAAGEGRMLFVEAGADLARGSSVHLDPISLAGSLEAPLLVVLSGDDDRIKDDAIFLQRYLQGLDVACAGVIINKVQSKDEFEQAHLESIQKTGFRVLGVIPRLDELNYYTLTALRESLLARVVTGDTLLDRRVRNVFVGAMPVEAAMQSADFNRPDLLVITSGDRSDLVLAAIERRAAGVVLTGGTLPPANIVGLSADGRVPLLSVTADSYRTAKMVDALEPLLHLEDPRKLDVLEKMVRDNVETEGLT